MFNASMWRESTRNPNYSKEWNETRSFQRGFPLQLCHFSTSDEPRFVRRSSQEKAARRKGCGWLGTRREAESAKGESVVHFNSRLLNPSPPAFPRYHSRSPFALHSISSLGLLPFGKSLQNECRLAPRAASALSPLQLSAVSSMQPDPPTFPYPFILIPGSFYRFSTFYLNIYATPVPRNSSAIRPFSATHHASSPQFPRRGRPLRALISHLL